jgi:lysophospholipase L1-like esterase
MKRLLPVSFAPLFTPHFVAFVVFGLLTMLVPLLTGCGVTTAPPATQISSQNANYQRLDTARTVFIGDQVTVNMFTPAFQQQHPNWTNAGVAGETTAQAVAAFQAQCIAPHPQICHVMIGLNDIIACVKSGAAFDQTADLIEADITQMVQEATAANIQVVVATEFPSLYGWPGTFDDDISPPVDILAGDINAWFTGAPINPGTAPSVTNADYWAVLTGNAGFIGDEADYLPGLSSDDVIPNAAGYSAMYPVMQAALEKAQLALSR